MACNSVSVIMPCYNGEQFVGDALRSVLRQTHAPAEILVVDDGSTDASAEIARSFGQAVRVIEQANMGESAARNRGMDQARSEWIAFIDADDVWHTTKLEKQLSVVASDVIGVHTDLYLFGDVSATIDVATQFGPERYNLQRLAVANCITCPSSLIVRRRIAPRFPEWTRYAEDHVFSLELVRRGQIRHVNEPLTGYRVHSGSQSRLLRFAVALRWHETITRWLSAQADLDSDAVGRIQSAWALQLANAMRRARRARAWSEYQEIREYLSQMGREPAVERALAEWQFPQWVYACADAIREARRFVRRSGCRERRQS